MTLLNEDLCALSTDAITLSIYAMEVFQIVIGVLFPIVDVEQQLITQCIKKFIWTYFIQIVDFDLKAVTMQLLVCLNVFRGSYVLFCTNSGRLLKSLEFKDCPLPWLKN